MRLTVLKLIFALATCSLVNAQDLIYPSIQNQIVIDTFHQTYVIEDNYRNLENIYSQEVQNWLSEQSKLSTRALNKASTKNHAYNLIDQYAVVRSKAPFKEGDYYYRYLYYGSLTVPALYQASTINTQFDLLVDPNFISRKDKIRLNYIKASRDSKLLAYQYSRNGSDWTEVNVVSTTTGTQTKDHLHNVKHSSIAWKNNGFFYAKYDSTNKFAATKHQKVYYHKIGDHQEQDSLIFARKNPNYFFAFKTSTNERFFLLKEIQEDTDIFSYYYIDYNSSFPAIYPLIRNIGDPLFILDSRNGKFIAESFLSANNGAVVEIDPTSPLKWRTIVPEYTNALLLFVKVMDEKLITVHQYKQRPILSVYDYTGNKLFTKMFSIGTSLSGFSGNPSDEEILYRYESYTVPSVVYSFNMSSFESRVIVPTEITYTHTDIIYEEVEYESKDGTIVPMLLVYKEGMKRDGENPTLLKSYGGFGVISTPKFDPGIVYFVRKGGVFAYANIRGGGDLGRDWRDEGRGINKQTSFDDFIAAAEYLISSGITSKSNLAANGVSNGGLVVAASAMQRPDLFKAVVPEVAPLDMLRFEKFTVGNYHRDEYGTTTTVEGFKSLLSFSPVHNITNDKNYPAWLVITSENDERVPPYHSYKFVAGLQSNPSQKNPVYLRVENNAGHSGSTNLYGTIKEISDKYGFIMEMIK